MANFSISGELLCCKNKNKNSCFEAIYLVETENLLEIKKRVDAEIAYEIFELFEFTSW